MPESYLDHLKGAIHNGWQHFFNALRPNQHQLLRDLLQDAYREEAQDVVLLSQHAERMPHPQFRERLRRIAEEEQAHVTWLRDKILVLGGNVPDVVATPKGATHAWEALLLDLEEEKRT